MNGFAEGEELLGREELCEECRERGCGDVWVVGQDGLLVTKAVHEGKHHQRVAKPRQALPTCGAWCAGAEGTSG